MGVPGWDGLSSAMTGFSDCRDVSVAEGSCGRNGYPVHSRRLHIVPNRSISNARMPRVLTYLLMWLGLAAVMPVQAQVLSPTYVWSWIHPTLASRHVCVHDRGIMVLCAYGGFSEGATLDSVKEVLSTEEFARVSRETEFAALRNGTAIIGTKP